MDLEEKPHNMVEVEVGGASCVQYSTVQYSVQCVYRWAGRAPPSCCGCSTSATTPCPAISRWVDSWTVASVLISFCRVKTGLLQVGDSLTAGTAVGEVGNSGTTYVPHLHAGDLVLSVT